MPEHGKTAVPYRAGFDRRYNRARPSRRSTGLKSARLYEAAKATAHRDRLVMGLISGTSMDGIDAAVVQIGGPAERPHVRLLAFATFAYPRWLQQRLLGIASGERATAGELSQLNFLLGGLFAEAASKICRRRGIPTRQLEVIGSHGQTIYHQGLASRLGNRRIASTLQMGEPAVIAERIGAPVVADFRTADMAAGGQGAPLVPIVDYLLFRDPKLGTVALNIGGIANLAVIPPGAEIEDIFGFDTGPGNMLMDGLVRSFTRGKRNYDAGGRRAEKGTVVEPLLTEILRDAFFRKPPPKSAGREQFGQRFLERYFLKRRAAFNDLLRTAAEFTAHTIVGAIERFVLPRVAVHRLIVSGGGAHNRFLMKRLAALLPQTSVQTSDRYGLPVDAKEAMAFALLADRSLHGLPGNVPSVTGARRAVVLGKLIRPGPERWRL